MRCRGGRREKEPEGEVLVSEGDEKAGPGQTDRERSGKVEDRQTDGRDKRVPWVACILLCFLAN